MPVEVRELVIRATVTQRSEPVPGRSTSNNRTDVERSVREAVEQFERIEKMRKER